jgi:hypothetical protein
MRIFIITTRYLDDVKGFAVSENGELCLLNRFVPHREKIKAA